MPPVCHQGKRERPKKYLKLFYRTLQRNDEAVVELTVAREFTLSSFQQRPLICVKYAFN